MKIELTPEEHDTFFKLIDANLDGVLSIDEWENLLAPKISAEAEFQGIMGDFEFKNPLELEERILDLMYRNRRIATELRMLKNRPDHNKMEKAKQELKNMKKNIIILLLTLFYVVIKCLRYFKQRKLRKKDKKSENFYFCVGD